MIKLSNVSKSFKHTKALKNVDLEFDSGMITGLIGFNGSGKTTTFNIIIDFLKMDSGSLIIDGKEPKKDFYKCISIISGTNSAANFNKMKSELYFMSSLHNLSKDDADNKIKELTEKFECDQFLNKKIRTLSKGNQQKVKIISALLNPNLKFLLMDEPFDGLDPIMVQKMKEYIKSISKDLTIVITSHRMDIIDDLCDTFYVLKEGEVIYSKNSPDDSSVTFITNIEFNLDELPEREYILDKKQTKHGVEITINGIDHSKDLIKSFMDIESYLYHEIKKKSASEAFLEGYSND